MAFGPLWPGICNDFIVEGILEALSSPSEFYHDRANGRLYYVPDDPTTPPKVMLAVTAPTLLRFEGSQENRVRNVTIRGVTFRGAAKTFLGPHVSTTNGADWSVPRSAALEFEGVDGATVDSCRFQTLGGSAVLWSGYVRNATVPAHSGGGGPHPEGWGGEGVGP